MDVHIWQIEKQKPFSVLRVSSSCYGDFHHQQTKIPQVTSEKTSHLLNSPLEWIMPISLEAPGLEMS